MKLNANGCLVEQIGEYLITSPKMPAREEFLNGDVTKKEDQMFEYTKVPSAVELKRMTTEERDAFEDREWNRRLNGVWFYNCGQPTWITGVNYYYLNYYNLDEGRPEYREADRQFFWVWDYCVKHPRCEGLLYITRRQQGKSYKGGCIGLEYASRVKNKHIGIQSKSDDDAKVLFQRAFFHSWKKLPAYFSPKFSNTNSIQTKEIRFEAPAQKGKAARLEDGGVYQEAELGTWIDFANSKENAYDGQKLGFFMNDEIFKKQLFNPIKRWSVVRKMFKQKGQVIAKSFHTSSVGEEIEEEGVARANEFWTDSNPVKVLDNGQTKSGVFRYFQPAYIGYMYDKYGRDLINESKAEFQAARKGFEEKNDNEGLLGEKRSNPFTVEEALLPDGKGGTYDSIVLADVVSKINTYKDLHNDEPWQTYRLTLGDESGTWVKAIPDPNGRFEFSWLPPDKNMLNQVQVVGEVITSFGVKKRLVPLNDVNFGIGCDPIDKRRVTNKSQASNFSAHGFWKYDPGNEANKNRPDYWPSGSFIMKYAHRLANNETMYEDMRLACILLGCKMLFENQKCKIEDHFRNMGCEAFLADRPAFTHTEHTSKQEAPGIPSSPLVIGKYVELTQNFISGRYENDEASLQADWRRMPWVSTNSQWINFDPEKTREFDEGVSGSFTLMHCMRYLPMAPPQEDVKDFELDM